MQEYFDTKEHPGSAWIGIALVAIALVALPWLLAGIGTAWVRITESRDPVRAALARPQHRRRLRRVARSRLHRVLRGRRVRLRAARLAALRSASAVLDHPADRRRRRVLLRRAPRRADAEAARRLPRDRHAGLRRDHPDLPQQPVAAGQPHQRPAGHHADRPVPHRQLQLREARDHPRPRLHRAGQVLLLPGHPRHLHHHPQPAPAELADRPRVGGDPRGRDRRARDGHQHAQHEAPRVRDGRVVRRHLRRHLLGDAGLHQPGELRAGRVDHGAVDGRAGRHGQRLRRDPRRVAAVVRARGAALHRRAGAAGGVRPDADRARGHPDAAVRPRARADDAVPARGHPALGAAQARAGGAARSKGWRDEPRSARAAHRQGHQQALRRRARARRRRLHDQSRRDLRADRAERRRQDEPLQRADRHLRGRRRRVHVRRRAARRPQAQRSRRRAASPARSRTSASSPTCRRSRT